MGLSMGKRCYTNSDCVAPNPNPGMYTVVRKELINNNTLLVVNYTGCTNFEGRKLMVFKGDFTPNGDLDPHFQEGNAGPIARLKPDKEGYKLAITLCKELN